MQVDDFEGNLRNIICKVCGIEQPDIAFWHDYCASSLDLRNIQHLLKYEMIIRRPRDEKKIKDLKELESFTRKETRRLFDRYLDVTKFHTEEINQAVSAFKLQYPNWLDDVNSKLAER